ncbi:GlcG/HbpS family heme-binding protein [Gluconobacter wancherniae]|uniref:GlcG/HbpS family heme-binding protein n=1 Tax=Gluconobacter wancherniae TaxID=1307955 RepID=UPI001B8D7519|nr:heme-binding protein [Gluconobacter wancherniae]MBS1089707.1 heme-binding protein [Gluconobacter wancherniae]
MTITLSQAQHALTACIDKAVALDIQVCVCVVDAGGRLVAFARMDGSNWASIYGCQGKALTAAATRCNSGAIPPESVVMSRISELEGKNMIYARGAVPLFRDGQLVGAIGAGGASADLDEACAIAGADSIGCTITA